MFRSIFLIVVLSGVSPWAEAGGKGSCSEAVTAPLARSESVSWGASRLLELGFTPTLEPNAWTLNGFVVKLGDSGAEFRVSNGAISPEASQKLQVVSQIDGFRHETHDGKTERVLVFHAWQDGTPYALTESGALLKSLWEVVPQISAPYHRLKRIKNADPRIERLLKEQGYLAEHESFTQTLEANHSFIRKHHQAQRHKIARTLQALVEPSRDLVEGTRVYLIDLEGEPYQVKASIGEKAFSPIEPGYASNLSFEAKCLRTGTWLRFDGIFLHQVSEYGFFSGERSRLGLTPAKVWDFFDFLRNHPASAKRSVDRSAVQPSIPAYTKTGTAYRLYELQSSAYVTETKLTFKDGRSSLLKAKLARLSADGSLVLESIPKGAYRLVIRSKEGRFNLRTTGALAVECDQPTLQASEVPADLKARLENDVLRVEATLPATAEKDEGFDFNPYVSSTQELLQSVSAKEALNRYLSKVLPLLSDHVHAANLIQPEIVDAQSLPGGRLALRVFEEGTLKLFEGTLQEAVFRTDAIQFYFTDLRSRKTVHFAIPIEAR